MTTNQTHAEFVSALNLGPALERAGAAPPCGSPIDDLGGYWKGRIRYPTPLLRVSVHRCPHCRLVIEITWLPETNQIDLLSYPDPPARVRKRRGD